MLDDASRFGVENYLKCCLWREMRDVPAGTTGARQDGRVTPEEIDLAKAWIPPIVSEAATR